MQLNASFKPNNQTSERHLTRAKELLMSSETFQEEVFLATLANVVSTGGRVDFEPNEGRSVTFNLRAELE